MNRREMLTGMAVASATVALPAPAVAKSLPVSRATWNAALARFRHHHNEHEAACVAHYSIEARYYAEKPQHPLGAEFRKGDTVETYHARLRADRVEFERADAECRSSSGFDVSEERQAEACDTSWNALGVLLATPAPGLAEAVQKIELATEYGRLIDELEPVCADLRRFISQERA